VVRLLAVPAGRSAGMETVGSERAYRFCFDDRRERPIPAAALPAALSATVFSVQNPSTRNR
jgi:hypothetical protein